MIGKSYIEAQYMLKIRKVENVYMTWFRKVKTELCIEQFKTRDGTSKPE